MRAHGSAVQTAHRNNNFDLIRLLAAMQVVINHANEWLRLPVPGPIAWWIGLFPGVAVFFVISGFLITQSYLDKGGALRPYVWARVARIYPGLWINLSIIMVMVLAAGALSWRALGTAHLWAYEAMVFLTGSTFFANLVFGEVHEWGGFFHHFPSGVTWTITVELGFYLLVPLIFLAPLRRRPFWLAFSMGVWFLLSMVVAWHTQQLRSQSPGGNITGILDTIVLPYLWIFLLGAFARVYWSHLQRWVAGRAHWWLLAYTGLSWWLWREGAPPVLDFKVLSAGNVLRLVLMALCVLSVAFSWTGCSRSLRGVDLSYGIYLYHMPIIWAMVGAGLVGHVNLWGVLLVLVSVAAALSWYLVEVPGLKLKRHGQRTEPLAVRA